MHKGSRLTFSGVVDTVVKHSPTVCTTCGTSLNAIPEVLLSHRKVLDIPPIALQYTEHQLYQKQCSCGCIVQGNYPANVTSSLQYGHNIEALVSYLHARQYVPYQRMEEFLKDVMNLPL